MRRRVALAVLSCVAAVGLLAHATRPTASKPSPELMLAQRAPAFRTLRAVDELPAGQGVPDPRASTRLPATTEVHTARAELEHAHPLGERHERLREQQALIGALNDALDLADAAALRTLLERYDAVQPEDPMRLAEGYERAADCIEADQGRQDEAAQASVRANAQRYYDDARASSVRRYVRRFCLEESGR